MQTCMADGFREIQYGRDASRGSSVYLWSVLEGADQDCVLSGSVSETGDDYTDCIIDVASAVGGVPLDWEQASFFRYAEPHCFAMHDSPMTRCQNKTARQADYFIMAGVPG